MFGMKQAEIGAERLIPLWARQEKSAELKSIQVRGKELYSYGSHYLLGKLMQFNGRAIAMVNVTPYYCGRGASATTRMQGRLAAKYAQESGNLVVETDTDAIGESVSLNSNSSDVDICAAIVATLERENARLYDRLAEISYSVPYYEFTLTDLRGDIEKHNALSSALGLDRLRIDDIPETYYQDAEDLGMFTESVSRNHRSRKQTVFSFNANSLCEFRLVPDHYTKSIDKHVL